MGTGGRGEDRIAHCFAGQSEFPWLIFIFQEILSNFVTSFDIFSHLGNFRQKGDSINNCIFS
jgi:hypothetical protein